MHEHDVLLNDLEGKWNSTMTIDVYSRYFSAELIYNEVLRHAAIVKLTSDSDAGQIRPLMIANVRKMAKFSKRQ